MTHRYDVPHSRVLTGRQKEVVESSNLDMIMRPIKDLLCCELKEYPGRDWSLASETFLSAKPSPEATHVMATLCTASSTWAASWN